ncbi:signal transduction histidine kinase, LytS [Thermobaculum terrenum ATCC BAA-798]|uniref:Signal transduction histidine kinase, LytS n=1 Tax=Thermobaculum terrenum (strain ATCC BAA-798 / CCMEE 7001 / YNP1) TaxID=525904 RepID=D1CGZ3_THET1|nr:ECF transporter S component [Thermobaculum terrenum]ACZ43014.1 signal transduction histidine kinase, LytS [Thermobaculum terrenum ATCC BAA-798]
MADTTPNRAGGLPFIRSISEDFTTRAWVLIPIGIGINVVGGYIAQVLRLPIFLDVIGTILVGVLAGPWVGALAGFLTNIVTGLVVNPTLLPYSATNLAIGLVAGILAVTGWFKSYWKVAVSGIIITIVAVVVSAPITVFVFGGVTGHGTDLIVGYFLATGNQLLSSVLKTSFIVEPIDKIISSYLAFFIARAIPARYRPPKARQTLPE